MAVARAIIAYVLILAGSFLVPILLQLPTKQVLAFTIFSMLLGGTFLFWRLRVAFAFAGLSLNLAFGIMDTSTLVASAGIDIILFLVGMMVLVGYLEEKRFFEVIVYRVLKVSGGDVRRLLVLLILMSATFSALIGEVTSILFMASTVLHLAARYRVSPVPFLIMVVFSTNIGSAATLIGNPVGVVIGLRAGLTFIDFLRWASPIVLAALFLSIPPLFFYYRKEIKELGEGMRKLPPIDGEKNVDGRSLILPSLLFGGTLMGLILHHQIELLLGLGTNSMLLGVAVAAGSIVLLIHREGARELIEKRVEWWSLTFFLLLFTSVGAVQATGLTKILVDGLLFATSGAPFTTFIAFTGIAGLLSAVLDNVLAVAAFTPVVEELGRAGMETFPFWWALLFAATFLGNLTLIGSTANIVAVGMLESRGGGQITLREWIVPGALVSLPTMLLAVVLLLVQIPL